MSEATTLGRVAELRVERLPLSQLQPHPRNPRIHPNPGTPEWNTLRASLDYDYFDPLVWNVRNGMLVSGHLRRKILLDLGFEQADCVVVDYDEPTHIARMLAANRLIGDPDKGAMKDLLVELDTGGFDMDLTGFDARALEDYIVPIIPEGEDEKGARLADQADELVAKWGVARGQLWAIGPHRLLCGDCTQGVDVRRLMGDERAALMNTDPPYGIAYTDETRVAADRAHVRPQRLPKWEGGIENDERVGADIQPFLESAFRTAKDVALRANAAWYLWHAHLTQGFFAAAAAAAANLVLSRQIIWVKPSLLFGFGDYHWRHELCFYGWVEGHRPPFFGQRNQTTVWDLEHDATNAERLHPTQKPVELFRRPILNHTHPDEIAYEPFAGSGSQLVAAERLGRRCYAIEIEPRWCAVILERLAELEPRPLDPSH